jgi:hypothetical protein
MRAHRLHACRIAAYLLAVAVVLIVAPSTSNPLAINSGPTGQLVALPSQSGASPGQAVDDESALRIAPALLGVLVAASTVLLQLWLKATSREPPSDKRHGLRREDLVWWLDWVVAAVVSFSLLALSAADTGNSLSTSQTITLVACFLFGLSGLPGLVRNWGYDKSTNPPALRTILGILIPNLVGAAILLAAVASGAELAG